jgi:hypothetical protein
LDRAARDNCDLAPDLARQRDWSGRAGPTGSTGTTRPRLSECGSGRLSARDGSGRRRFFALRSPRTRVCCYARAITINETCRPCVRNMASLPPMSRENDHHGFRSADREARHNQLPSGCPPWTQGSPVAARSRLPGREIAAQPSRRSGGLCRRLRVGCRMPHEQHKPEPDPRKPKNRRMIVAQIVKRVV